MRDVYIVGIGQTKVKEHWDKTLRQLAVQSILAALDDAGVDGADMLYVGNMLGGGIAGQEHLGALIADEAGLRGIEAAKVEAACGSGAAALRAGYLAVAGGLADVVIVTGVEKMTDVPNGAATKELMLAADGDYEGVHGLSFVSINALLMQRYMYEFGVDHRDFAPFTINAHDNAVGNEYAMFPRPVSFEAFERARVIATPITLMDASPVGDGAATVVLAAHKTPHAVRVRASAVATDSVALHDRADVLALQGARDSAYKAYKQVGIAPQDVDFFELHDAFTIIAALSLEACGFAARGDGWKLAQEGAIKLDGSVPIATLGGLKGRGHPVGATGVYQIIDATRQLRGEAGRNQLDCHLGLVQNIGGSGATVITHILSNE